MPVLEIAINGLDQTFFKKFSNSKHLSDKQRLRINKLTKNSDKMQNQQCENQKFDKIQWHFYIRKYLNSLHNLLACCNQTQKCLKTTICCHFLQKRAWIINLFVDRHHSLKSQGENLKRHQRQKLSLLHRSSRKFEGWGIKLICLLWAFNGVLGLYAPSSIFNLLFGLQPARL